MVSVFCFPFLFSKSKSCRIFLFVFSPLCFFKICWKISPNFPAGFSSYNRLLLLVLSLSEFICIKFINIFKISPLLFIYELSLFIQHYLICSSKVYMKIGELFLGELIFFALKYSENPYLSFASIKRIVFSNEDDSQLRLFGYDAIQDFSE